MRWFGWWRTRRIQVPVRPVEMPTQQDPSNHSSTVVEQSRQKLDDALKTKKEVTQLLKVNDQFAEALQRAMRRSHG